MRFALRADLAPLPRAAGLMLRFYTPSIVRLVLIPCIFLLIGWFVPSEFEKSTMLAPWGIRLFA